MTELLFRLFIKKNTKDERSAYGVLAGIVGLFLNFSLSMLKIVLGILTGSISILGDSVNNLSDSVSSVITMVGFRLSGKPADEEHPYGHGRIEYISGFLVAIFVIAVALELLRTSVAHIITPNEMDVSVATIIILACTILVKLWMSVFYFKISKKINSAAMRATAVDSRSDCITTGVALISVLTMLVFHVNIDGYTGAIVAFFVIYSGINSARETLEPLLGERPDPDIIYSLKKVAMSHDSIIGVHDLRLHEYGPGHLVASMHVEMPAELTFVEEHEIIDTIEAEIVAQGLVREITIHSDPVDLNDEKSIILKEYTTACAKKINSKINILDFRTRGEDPIRILFDMEIPFKEKRSNEELVEELKNKILSRVPDADIHINADREDI
ncbi:MAG: cation diffusion facilitator family transporter [Lachnospiraceae bacterium]|nr:cation diffusion facilitator family transporter [Lachnospiraceae bacterium]